MEANSRLGVPAMRPVFLDFEEAAGDEDFDYQYMYGPDLLVAPVTEPGAQEWDVLLPGPAADWVFLWDEAEEVVPGPAARTVPAPMGATPVFYRAGSSWTGLFRAISSKYGNMGNPTEM